MPAPSAYPGVYSDETTSGVRTIARVATSLTAFVGRAIRGPIDTPVAVGSYGDFERVFGGLWSESRLGFSLRDFYANGGGEAVVVRLYNIDCAVGAAPSFAEINANGLILRAACAGAWGNALRVRIEAVDVERATAVARLLGDGVQAGDVFTLRVRDMSTGAEEEYREVTSTDSARRIDRLLEERSLLLRAVISSAQPTAHPGPPGQHGVWDDAAFSGVTEPASDGLALEHDSFTGAGKAATKQGLYALDGTDLFNLLCIPPYKARNGIPDQDVDATVVGDAARYCEDRRAFLIVDPPSSWEGMADAKAGLADIGTRSRNAALYFPCLRQLNPLADALIETFAPSGAIAGVIARTDASRGVWKAPAGAEAVLGGLVGLSVSLTDGENGQLNPLAINCLRNFPALGNVVWGARTLQGDDQLASDWKYVPVRRLALFIEESLFRGTRWVAFEPNDEPLWAQIRLNVGAFMHSLFAEGAFQGATAHDAYFVKCSRETTTQNDINNGTVNIEVGFAPLKPAEFVVIRIRQTALQV